MNINITAAAVRVDPRISKYKNKQSETPLKLSNPKHPLFV